LFTPLPSATRLMTDATSPGRVVPPVTVPDLDRTGPARLLDLVEGRSASVFQTWLDAQPERFRTSVQVVAMNGSTGFKTAAAAAVPDAVTVMDPFHVVALVEDKLDLARQRVQHDTLGHRGRSDDPLYRARRTLRTGKDLLTDKQKTRLAALFAADQHLPVEVGWCVYQDVIAAYRNPDKTAGKTAMTRIIDSLRHGVPAGLDELAQLGRTLHRRRYDILAWFTHPGASNGPTEAIDGHLEHLRGIALGFRNLTNYRIRSPLEAGGFRPLTHSLL
jgi:transposase